MACGCQCSCPSSSNRTYQQEPNWQSMLSSKLVSKPGMNLPFLHEAIAALEIVEVDAPQDGPAPQA
jgi:hypothetical protein